MTPKSEPVAAAPAPPPREELDLKPIKESAEIYRRAGWKSSPDLHSPAWDGFAMSAKQFYEMAIDAVPAMVAEIERLRAELVTVTAQREKWLDNFNRSEQFQTSRAAAPAPPPLLAKAVADRDARPWRYYKLDHETMKKFCEKLADQCDNLLAAAPAPPPQEPNESEVMTNELPKMHLPRAQHGELVPGASATVGASCVWCGAPVEEPWCGNCEATTVRAAAPATPPQEPTKTCTCPLEHFPDRHDDHVPSCPRFKAAPAPPLQAADDWRTLTPEDMAIAEQEPKR